MRCLYRPTFLLLLAVSVGASPKPQRDWRESEDIMAKTTGWMGGASGATGDWEHPSNWTNGQPDAADSVFVRETSVYAIDTNLDRTNDNGTAATETLTITDTFNANNNETVTIGSKTYTFQTTLTNVDGNVKIGADDEASIANLVAAIGLGAGAGTTYAAATTLHTQVTAVVGAPANTMDITARQKNASGNSLTTTEAMMSGAFGGATMSGGVDGNGLNLVIFQTHEDYTKDIGASGLPLKLTADKLVHAGAGTLHLFAGRSGGTTFMDNVIIDSDNAVNAAVLDGDGNARYLAVQCISGGITFQAPDDGGGNAAVNNLYVAFRTNPASDVRLTVTSSAGKISNMHIVGGIISSSCPAHNLIDMSGGHLTLEAAAGWSTGTSDHLYLHGGTVEYNIANAILDLGLARIFAGVLDTTKTLNAKVITNVDVFPAGVLVQNKSFTTLTLNELGDY